MPRPNILWIVTTQWRAQALGCAGDPNARTPCVDRLATEGVRMAQAVTPHPFGPFARAALLTGVPSPANGLRDYFDPLPVDARTIAHALEARGYTTAFLGKWHLAQRDPAAPLVGEAHARMIVPPGGRGGFRHWEGFESGFLINDPWLHGTHLPQPTRFMGYQADVLCDRAASWIRHNCPVRPAAGNDQPAKPYFCVVSLEAPHPPYDAPWPAGIVAVDPADISLAANVPLGGAPEIKARKELAGYYAHIAATDRAIGRLVESVRTDVAGETIVVVTSVHGDMHGAHGLFRKGWPHEESVRVPLVVTAVSRAGGDTAKVSFGLDAAAPVSLVDLPALTLGWVDPTGLRRPANGSGTRVQGSLHADERASTPPSREISMPSVVALPHQCDRIWRGIRSRQRKLVLNEDGSPWLFFDLEHDPLETNNLAADKRWADELAQWIEQIENRADL